MRVDDGRFVTVEKARLRRVSLLERLQFAPKVFRHMPDIIRRLSIARHILPQLHPALERALQDVHLVQKTG